MPQSMGMPPGDHPHVIGDYNSTLCPLVSKIDGTDHGPAIRFESVSAARLPLRFFLRIASRHVPAGKWRPSPRVHFVTPFAFGIGGGKAICRTVQLQKGVEKLLPFRTDMNLPTMPVVCRFVLRW